MDDESAEQAYLQVDPRCYVRQNSNVSLNVHRKSDTPRLEKGHSLNVDTRPSPSTNCVSPHRQSSFDVAVAHRFQQQQQQQQQAGSTLSPGSSTQHDLYYTPHGSSLSVMVNQSFTTPLGSQHLSAPVPSTQRKYSTGMILERKNLSATLESSGELRRGISLQWNRSLVFRSNIYHSLVDFSARARTFSIARTFVTACQRATCINQQ